MKGIEGVKVVELCGYVAAPACPRILAEMGATVIKVEAFSGDEYRTNAGGFGISKTDIDDPSFDLASMNKDWVSINIKSEKGREFFDKLIAGADVFVTSLRDKALERAGLDYETFHRQFPHVVWAQMRGYGWRGPEKDTKGFDTPAYLARGGILGSFPQAGEHYAPTNWPAAFGDWNASMSLTMGILAALYRAKMIGDGDRVTTNLYHCACWAMQIGVSAAQFGDPWPKSRKEAKCPTNNSYRSKDGVWFIICFGSYDMFAPLVFRNIGLDHLIEDERYNNLKTLNETGTNKDVIAMMEEAFAKQDWAHWEQIFRDNEIPYSKVRVIGDILEDEEAYANDILRPIPYDAFGEKSLVTTPVRLDSVGDPVLYRSRPIGYDTRRYMQEFGYSDEQIDALVESGDVKCYDGEPLPEKTLEPVYGPGTF